jgi:hypothetical protein
MTRRLAQSGPHKYRQVVPASLKSALSHHSNPAYGGWLFLNSGREAAHHLIHYLADGWAHVSDLTNLCLQNRVLGRV